MLVALDAACLLVTRQLLGWEWGFPKVAGDHDTAWTVLATLGNWSLLTRGLLALVFVFACRESTLRAFGLHWQDMGRRFSAAVTCGALAGMVVLLLFAVMWIALHATEQGELARLPVRFDSTAGFWAWMVVYVVVGPPIEEFLYRGILYAPQRRVMGPAAAVVTNGLLFGAAHWLYGIPLSSVPGYAVAGMILAWIYDRTQSVVCTTFMHASANLIGALVGLIDLCSEGAITRFFS